MAISLFSQDLGSFPAQRAKHLDATVLGGIDRVFALVWPNYEPPIDPIPQLNRAQFDKWRRESGVPLWGWFNAKENQHEDAARLIALTAELNPDGWLLDIEGEWTKEAKLTTLIAGAKATGKPIIASLAATTSSHVNTDFRTLDLNGIPVDWQCYFDSGEGQDPATCVRELTAASFVIPGWEYRAKWGTTYTWGRVGDRNDAWQCAFNSYRRAGAVDGRFGVAPRAWGFEVSDRKIRRLGKQVGLLMGRAAYKNIRATLDTTRGANDKHTPAEWSAIAASAKIPGAAKRPISVYMAEHASDDVLVAIAKGAV